VPSLTWWQIEGKAPRLADVRELELVAPAEPGCGHLRVRAAPDQPPTRPIPSWIEVQLAWSNYAYWAEMWERHQKLWMLTQRDEGLRTYQQLESLYHNA